MPGILKHNYLLDNRTAAALEQVERTWVTTPNYLDGGWTEEQYTWQARAGGGGRCARSVRWVR